MDLSDEGPLPVEDPEAVRRSRPRPRRARRVLVPVSHRHVGPARDAHRARRVRLGDDESNPAEPLNVDRLALGDGTVAEVAGERALDHLAAHVHVGELRGRGEHDAVGVLDVDGGDGDGVADLHAGVRASVRVDEDGSFWGVRAAGPHLRDRGALTADLDGVAAEEAEPLSGGFGEPGDARPASRFSAAPHRSRRPAVSFIRSVPATRPLPLPAIGGARAAAEPAIRPPPTATPYPGRTRRWICNRQGTCAATRSTSPATPASGSTTPTATAVRSAATRSRSRGSRPLTCCSGATSRGLPHPDADPVGFERFFVESAAAADRFAVRYLVYADLRDRGFYLSPAREPWPGGDVDAPDAVDFVAYERGSTPDTGT